MSTISAKRCSQLYSVISDNIMELRIAVKLAEDSRTPISYSDLDFKLYELVELIWKEQARILNVPA